jgi:hypothetical protein
VKDPEIEEVFYMSDPFKCDGDIICFGELTSLVCPMVD